MQVVYLNYHAHTDNKTDAPGSRSGYGRYYDGVTPNGLPLSALGGAFAVNSPTGNRITFDNIIANLVILGFTPPAGEVHEGQPQYWFKA